ncbi:uncharacterized protein KY384_001290 [Bacidia gigantensis]|uniref:uncharacterized protein n=1 Tax=Bacidia gigantensis TaxID=2732470 RepID=UPI001D03F6F0|nr:uncharacterized protein KY384_001290 [Bacidia gigantensis]KAG8533550.1 hypothetical protein KY384_001290 [Bacidia gigantensis]
MYCLVLTHLLAHLITSGFTSPINAAIPAAPDCATRPPGTTPESDCYPPLSITDTDTAHVWGIAVDKVADAQDIQLSWYEQGNSGQDFHYLNGWTRAENNSWWMTTCEPAVERICKITDLARASFPTSGYEGKWWWGYEVAKDQGSEGCLISVYVPGLGAVTPPSAQDCKATILEPMISLLNESYDMRASVNLAQAPGVPNFAKPGTQISGPPQKLLNPDGSTVDIDGLDQSIDNLGEALNASLTSWLVQP